MTKFHSGIDFGTTSLKVDPFSDVGTPCGLKIACVSYTFSKSIPWRALC